MSREEQIEYIPLAMTAGTHLQRVRGLDLLGDLLASSPRSKRLLRNVESLFSSARTLYSGLELERMEYIAAQSQLPSLIERVVLLQKLAEEPTYQDYKLQTQRSLIERSIASREPQDSEGLDANSARVILTLNVAHQLTPQSIECLVQQYKGAECQALAPLAALIPALLRKWDRLARVNGLYHLIRRFLCEARQPSYGFYALGELLYTAGAVELAAWSMVASQKSPAPYKVPVGLDPQAPIAKRRASRLVLLGARALALSKPNEAAKLLAAWKASTVNTQDSF